MAEPDPYAKEKPAVSERPVGKARPDRKTFNELILDAVHRKVSRDPAFITTLADAFPADSFAASVLKASVLKPSAVEEKDEEVAEIYHRIDRELAVEEARADRLLRLYNL